MSRISVKLGIPAILGILLLGLAINVKYTVFDLGFINSLHTVSLAMILFYAGLKTNVKAIRGFLSFGIWLAVAGSLLTALILAVGIWFISSDTMGGIEFGFSQLGFPIALMVGVSMASTDSAAIESVLAASGRSIPKRLGNILEFESALNCSIAILALAVAISLMASTVSSGHGTVLRAEIIALAGRLVIGLVVGIGMGYFSRLSIEKLITDRSQLLMLGLSLALMAYGVGSLAGKAGFFSAFVTGVFLGNNKYSNNLVSAECVSEIMLPFNEMTEISIFFIFGLISTPKMVLSVLPIAFLASLVLMFIARPLSVLILSPLSPFTMRENLLLSWCGLRGAVPLALGFEGAEYIPKIVGIDPVIAHQLLENCEGMIFSIVV
ncbi:MAG: sodium:proton antiporter, partial [Proteobacteria bacterium]|nr:sodium:proton antiporter [Pseudomonadota bacterium]